MLSHIETANVSAENSICKRSEKGDKDMTNDELVKLIDVISMTRLELERAFHEVEVFKEIVDYHRSEVDRSLERVTVIKRNADRDLTMALEKLEQTVSERVRR